MYKHWKYYAKWKKSGAKDHILYDSIMLNVQHWEKMSGFKGLEKERDGGMASNGYRVSFIDDENDPQLRQW